MATLQCMKDITHGRRGCVDVKGGRGCKLVGQRGSQLASGSIPSRCIFDKDREVQFVELARRRRKP